MTRKADAYVCCRQNLSFKKLFLKKVLHSRGISWKEKTQLFIRVEIGVLNPEKKQYRLKVFFSDRETLGLYDIDILKSVKISCRRIFKKTGFNRTDFYMNFESAETFYYYDYYCDFPPQS